MIRKWKHASHGDAIAGHPGPQGHSTLKAGEKARAHQLPSAESELFLKVRQRDASDGLQGYRERATVLHWLKGEVSAETSHQCAGDIKSQAAGFRVPLKGAK